ncbi:hypothetical protein [Pseudonocardia sp.]|uniref:hypothetical protein n=1 Tax=Pseudonocardia sp. TaxID=60912 RepID=UPI002620A1EE|nr:hypothetical protein [Pseudonocardia sp.]
MDEHSQAAQRIDSIQWQAALPSELPVFASMPFLPRLMMGNFSKIRYHQPGGRVKHFLTEDADYGELLD